MHACTALLLLVVSTLNSKSPPDLIPLARSVQHMSETSSLLLHFNSYTVTTLLSAFVRYHIWAGRWRLSHSLLSVAVYNIRSWTDRKLARRGPQDHRSLNSITYRPTISKRYLLQRLVRPGPEKCPGRKLSQWLMMLRLLNL